MEAAGSARLTDAIPAERAVTTTIPRSEVAEAVGDESTTPELHLQVAQRTEDGGEERSTVAIKWDRGDLERMLAEATSDSIVLTFDRDELAKALADFEAHGLRAKALVFAVAVTGALGTAAGVATAMPYTETGGAAPSSSATMVTDVSSGGGYVAPAAASAADSMVTDASSSGGYVAPAAAADSMLTDASSAGGYVAPAATAAADSMVTDASSAGGYVAPAEAAAADTMLTDASSGGYAAPVEAAGAGSMLTDASSGGGYVAPAEAAAASSMLTDASSGGGYPAPATSDDSSGFLDVSAPSPTDAAMTGVLALAIAGAAFATRRRGTAPRPV